MALKRVNGYSQDKPEKKTKFLDDSTSGEDDEQQEFTINEEYARRFEHNEKRKELQRLEGKYGRGKVKVSRNDESEKESDSESDVSEDDDGEFATVDVDAEINDTLNAIRNKDPRVYNKDIRFYKDFEASAETKGSAEKEKTMTLKDYHRINLIDTMNGDGTDAEEKPKTYVQEQEDIKEDLFKAMRAAATEDEDSNDEAGGFLKVQKKPTDSGASAISLPDTSVAEKDPETYLSNFFAARAWVPAEDSRFAHLDSDDSEDEDRADAFESAYNLRFEDPEISNITLKSHARDAVDKFSVRREEKSRRGKVRELERQTKAEEKAEKATEKARLRKLMVEQMESKIKLIRKAAGGGDIDITDWAKVLEDDWDDEKFNKEMEKRFGDDYYEQDDAGTSSDDVGGDKKKHKKKKPKKPTWDDDIDIKDLVTDFVSGDEAIILSDDEVDSAEEQEFSRKKLKQEKADQKSQSRRDRRIIETLADQAITLDGPRKNKDGLTFGYRETSPSTFGLTPLDILAADDADLNQWVGLKKLAPFRDSEKKDKDKRRLGKKGRLRQWRMETFGKKDIGLEDWAVEGGEQFTKPEHGSLKSEDGGNIKEGSRRKKRKRGNKKRAEA